MTPEELTSNYRLLGIRAGKKECKSHEGIPVEHLFGNTNWHMETIIEDGMQKITFTCQVCGQARIYKQNTEKTLL